MKLALALVRLAAVLCLFVSSTFAQLRVNVMPGYPNAPRTSPDQRRPVRPFNDPVSPNKELVLWGSVNGGDSVPAGTTYSWSLATNPDVSVSVDASGLSGTVANPRFIHEVVRLSLESGSSAEVIGATLTVTTPGGESASDYVEIAIVSNADAASDEPLERQQVDVNIAIEDGLRYLYLQQETSLGPNQGRFSSEPAYTAFVLWAFQNQGHLSTNDSAQDVYARPVSLGLDYIFRNSRSVPAISSPRAVQSDVIGGENVGEASVLGLSDQNENGRCIRLFGVDGALGYRAPILCSAIVASNMESIDPTRTIDIVQEPGPGIVTVTYKQFLEDVVDWIGGTQTNSSSTAMGPRGGWNYNPFQAAGRSDMSINSWMYVALEGSESVFGVDVPNWIKRECEYSLAYHQQYGDSNGYYFGYDSPGCGHGPCLTTTGGGISGIVVVETERSPMSAGSVLDLVAIDALDSVAEKRALAVRWIGSNWGYENEGYSYGGGNKGNPYCMWTVARGLRLTANALGVEKVVLENGGIQFDWETGERLATGVIDLSPARKGYFQWIIENQDFGSTVTSWGRWDNGWYDTTFTTAAYVLVLTPKVFLQPCPAVVSIPVVDLAPSASQSFETGSVVALSGRVDIAATGRPVSAVLINGDPADSIDASGRFFEQVVLAPGTNTFEITAIDRCGESTTEIVLEGLAPGDVDFANYEDVTFQVAPQYSNTTWNHLDHVLQFDVRLCNTSENPLLGPAVMVFDHIANPSVTLESPDGFTPSGDPYVLFANAPDNAPFAVGDCSQTRRLRFHSPTLQGISFSLAWLAPTNLPPSFTSIPVVQAEVDQLYAYDAGAIDPNGQSVTYALVLGPAGMTVEPASGLVAWGPTATDLGSHTVVVRATDAFGGSATQQYSLEVVPSIVNRPPFFSSAPITRADLGAPYTYVALATDPDLDALVFSKLDGPTGLAVSSSGVVSWDFPLPDDTGNTFEVSVKVEDPHGAYAVQAWTLTVGDVSSNPNAPSIFTTPPVTAVVGGLYLYQPIASDDDGDSLRYSLTTAPTGMVVDEFSGRIEWTPGSSQAGAREVVLVVSDGALPTPNTVSQAWTIQVFQTLPNRPPVIDSVPSLVAVVGQTYTYDVAAFDPDGDAVTFSFAAAQPAGMTIDPNTGVVQWTPASIGTFVVAVRATDPENAVGNQVFELDVIPVNGAPVITSSPDTTAILGQTYYSTVIADDPDDHPLHFELDQGPSGMTVHPQTGLVRWVPGPGTLGDHDVRIVVSDGFYGEAAQSWVLSVANDTQPPAVFLDISTDPAIVHQSVAICVNASDLGGVVAKTLSIDGVDQSLSNGCTTFTPPSITTLTLVGTATDTAGNIGTTMRPLAVVDPAAAQPHVVIASPQAGQLLSGPTPIVATIDGPNDASLAWTVRIAPDGTTAWRDLASGNGPITSGEIALFDTTLLQNGRWRLQVLASDATHAPSGFELPIDVVGEFKLGNYRTSFVDMTIPVAGIPLTVVRNYDSLDTKVGDFGAGWRLGLPGDVRDTTREDGIDTYNSATRVYVTRPDGQRVGFKFAPQPSSWLFPWLLYPRFEADPGVFDKLELTTDDLVFGSGGVYYADFFSSPLNPSLFRFETKQGVKYVIDEVGGLIQVEDVNGNTIDVTPGGLVSSTGVALTFTRDGQGRITRIDEPDEDPSDGVQPPHLEYAYTPAGNLASFRDRLGNLTTYAYEQPGFPNYLTRVQDPLGRPVVRNVFDADGRLVAQCNADGNVLPPYAGCVVFDLDAQSDTQTIFDARGNRSDLVLNEQGRVLRERRFLDASTVLETVRTYDADGNVLTDTDPEGNTTTFTYDDRGNQLSRTDPAGRTWVWTYNDCDKVAIACDPAGGCTTYEYDASCNRTAVVDALGRRTEFAYNSYGQLTDFWDRLHNNWHVDYGADGFPTGYRDPFGAVTQLEFGGNGDLLSTIDRTGRRTDFEYDAEQRVRFERWDDGRVIEYRYDAAGQMTLAHDPDSRLAMSYWPTGLMRSVDNSGTPGVPPVVLEYRYDANGNTTHVQDSLGGVTEYVYDALNRLSSAMQYGASSPISSAAGLRQLAHPIAFVPGVGPAAVLPKRIDFQLDGAGLVRHISRFSDLAATQGVFRTALEYECGGCPGSVTDVQHEASVGARQIGRFQYSRDAVGRVTERVDAAGVHYHTLDAMGQILSVDHPDGGPVADEWYEYDAMGNRSRSHLSSLSVYSTIGNRLLEDDDRLFAYNAMGEVEDITAKVDGSITCFERDARRRLVAVVRCSSTGDEAVERFRYDVFDRPIRVQRAAEEVARVFDGQAIALEFDHTGAVVARALVSAFSDDPIAIQTEGDVSWLALDANQSVTHVVDAVGAVASSRQYDSFGNSWSVGGVDPLSLRFQGKEHSDATGLTAYGARQYVPALGRFLSSDPVEPFGYELSFNNPEAFPDPSGLGPLIEYWVNIGRGGASVVLRWGKYGGRLAFDLGAHDFGICGKGPHFQLDIGPFKYTKRGFPFVKHKWPIPRLPVTLRCVFLYLATQLEGDGG